MRSRKHAGSFTSRFDGMNRRKPAWICAHCNAWHNAKTKQCQVCQGGEILYFASKEEASRYAALRLQLRVGMITNLEVQVRYPIVINNIKIADYIADFRYTDREGKEVIEDSKPAKFRTDIFKLKAKLIHAIYGIIISEVTT